MDSAMSTAAIEVVSRAVAGYFESAAALSAAATARNEHHALTSRRCIHRTLGTHPWPHRGADDASASVCLCVYATGRSSGAVNRSEEVDGSIPRSNRPVVMGSVLIASMVILIAITAANFAKSPTEQARLSGDPRYNHLNIHS